jgi:hypothetical protein
MSKPLREGFVGDDERPVAIVQAQEPQQEEQQQPEPDEWPIVIKLRHKPIKKSPTETIDELTFREPTTSDLINAGGNPVRTDIVDDANGKPTFIFHVDDPKMIRVMANMSGILDAFLKQMDPRDYASAAYRLRRFFVPEQGIW